MKFNMNQINCKIDHMNLNLINNKEKNLILQMNYTILTVFDNIYTQNYSYDLIYQLNNLVDKINEALNNIKYYNIYIVLYAIQVSLKLLYIFNNQKAKIIWDKLFINDLLSESLPLLLLNEHKISNLRNIKSSEEIDDKELIVYAAEQLI